MENSIQQAKHLFENKEYKEAFAMATDLYKEGIDKKEALVITIKAFILQMPSPLHCKENISSIISLVGKACNEAESIDEVLNIEHDIRCVIDEWKAQTVPRLLGQIVLNPTLDQWGMYYPIFLEFVKMDLETRLAARHSNPVTEYCNENGIELKEFSKKFPSLEIVEALTDEAIKALEFITSEEVFKKAKEYLSQYAYSSAEFLKNNNRKILEMFMVAENIVKWATPKEKNHEWYERTMFEAEIISCYLDASVFPNGREMSLYQGERGSKIGRLKEIYSELKEYDSNFEEPELPSCTAKQLPAQSNGGGCYVATAVYGSYDCPEVWTLRRFRDYTLAETWYGRAFIRTYYAVSPTLVKWFGKTEWFKNIWKPTLDRMVDKLNRTGVADTPYNDREW